MIVKRTISVAFGAAVFSMAMFAGIAYACTNLATLNLSTASGNVGDNVTVTGSSFRTPREATDAAMPVVLRWNGAEGPELGQVTPDPAGNISATFAIPESRAGSHVILATQLDAKGEAAFGTPARASFQILAANGESVASLPGTQPVVTDGSGSGILALTVGLGVLGLGLFAAGFTAFARQVRRQQVPTTAKVRDH